MKKIFFPLFLFFILFTTSFYSQVHEEWVQRYNGPGNGSDYASSIAVDGSGNVYITGGSIGSGTNHSDYVTVKYNSSGVQQWVRRYDGTGNGEDWANSITLDASGNVYVTGASFGNGTSWDYATIKYNTNGVQQWVQRYNGPGNDDDEAISLTVDGSGNVYVTGGSNGNGTNSDYATIKYNSNGVQQWVQRYNGPGNNHDGARCVAVDGSGNVYVAGLSKGSGTDWDYATIEYNANGVQQWVGRYNGPGNGSDEPYAMALDPSGNVYVTGASTGLGGLDYATVKYNTNGVLQWFKRYNGPANDEDVASSIAVDGSGNVYVTGWSIGLGTYYDCATFKYNTNGVQQWIQRYNRTGDDDEAYSIAVDASGNVYVTGFGFGTLTMRDYLTIKYNSSGVQQWLQSYDGPGNVNDYATSLVLDGSGNVYVTGYSAGNGSENDIATIKYSQNIGIRKISSEVPDKFSLFQNYPNPFNPSTKIKFSLPSPSKGGVTLVVYDMLGRPVASLIPPLWGGQEGLKPGTYEVEFSANGGASGLTSGVYFYRLTSGDFTSTQKMVLLK